MDTQPRGHGDRHQRWARSRRAALREQSHALPARGLSPRQAANRLDVPRTTLQAWRAWQDRLDACPQVVAFFESRSGRAFLHRLILAFPVVFVEVGACGMRLVCLCLKRTGLDRCVGASSGTQPQVKRHVEEAIVAYQREETTRLAQAMPPQESTATPAETLTGGLCLVAIEPVRNYSVLAHTAAAREHDPWNALMQDAVAGLHCQVIQATSDAAPGLLASVEQPLGAHHSPDLLHVPPELRKAVAAPMAAKQRAAAQAVTTAAEPLSRVQEPIQPVDAQPERRRPGRPPQAVPSPEQAQQEGEATRQEYQRLPGQREQVSQSMRAIGHADHCVDLDRGMRRNGTLMVSDIQHQIDTLRTSAPQEGLSQACFERIEQAERVVPTMQATLACVSGYVRQQGQQREVTSPPSFAMHARLIPS
jgi:hypothetical protein